MLISISGVSLYVYSSYTYYADWREASIDFLKNHPKEKLLGTKVCTKHIAGTRGV